MQNAGEINIVICDTPLRRMRRRLPANVAANVVPDALIDPRDQ
jgi:hypothetical protein